MTMLTICQDAASELGLAQPALVAGSSDLNAQKLLRFANQALKELVRYHDWQSITDEHTGTTVAQEVQSDGLPEDFGRFVYNAQIWNRTQNLPLIGPTSHRIWSQLKNGITGGVTGWWRIMGGQLHILPAPAAGETIAFDYVSRNGAASSGGTPKAAFDTDSDVCRIVASTGETIGEDLLVLEIVWRWRASLGLATYAEAMATCEREKEKAAGRDRGTGRIRPDNPTVDWPPQPFWDQTVG